MKRVGGAVAVIVAVICSFLLLGSNRAEAMSNESAALLTAAVVLAAPPVIQAMTGGFYYPAPSPRFVYYPVRTEVVVIGGGHYGYERDRGYWRGHHDQRRYDHRRWRADEARPYYRDRY
jgi:hypothetical protein